MEEKSLTPLPSSPKSSSSSPPSPSPSIVIIESEESKIDEMDVMDLLKSRILANIQLDIKTGRISVKKPEDIKNVVILLLQRDLKPVFVSVITELIKMIPDIEGQYDDILKEELLQFIQIDLWKMIEAATTHDPALVAEVAIGCLAKCSKALVGKCVKK